MASPDYSIIIPAYNEQEHLPATLSAIGHIMQEIRDYSGEIIVVDNNSTDCTKDIAVRHGATVVFEERRQIARARNAGARVSHGTYLIFLDADTIIPLSLLRKTLDALTAGTACGGGALIEFDAVVGVIPRMMVWTWECLSRTMRWAAGSYLFCLREAFVDIGGFDERYYAGEEIVLSQALVAWGKKRGLKMMILDEYVITSARKLRWFRSRDLVKAVVQFLLCPALLKSQDACWVWYRRPSQEDARR